MKRIKSFKNVHHCCSFKRSLFAFFFLLSVDVAAQHKIIPLYTSAAPGSETWTWKEKEFFVKAPLNANVIYNITSPTLTVVRPATANGCAVIICPGGGFRVLNFESEGIKYANKLALKGVTVFVLKYRLVQSFTDDPWQEMMTAMRTQDSLSIRKFEEASSFARADLNAAVRYLRMHAAELKIDSARIGVLGFSSGGAMSANLAYNFLPDVKPAFVAPIYCVISRINERNVKPNAPPLFIAAATDDMLAPVSNSVALYNDWLSAKRPAELHIYAKGGHGLKGSPAEDWIIRFEEWLDAHGFLKTAQ